MIELLHPTRPSQRYLGSAQTKTNRVVWPAVLTVVAVLTACSATTHIDSDVAHDYRTSVELGAVERGWTQTWVGRLVDEPRIIQHKIEVQADLAGDLVRMSNRERRQTVGPRVCPKVDHSIWQQIQPGHDIQVELSTKKNGPFATVSCRSAVL